MKGLLISWQEAAINVPLCRSESGVQALWPSRLLGMQRVQRESRPLQRLVGRDKTYVEAQNPTSVTSLLSSNFRSPAHDHRASADARTCVMLQRSETFCPVPWCI